MPAYRRSQVTLIAALLVATIACNPVNKPGEQPGMPFFAAPIRIQIPGSLAAGATAETIDLVTDQTGAQWDVAPAHLQMTFQDYALQTTFQVPQLFVYPAQQYAALNPSAAESIRRLQAVLADPSKAQNNDNLPRVPFLNAGQVLAAQQKVLHFSGGSGVRFITQYAQGVSPINNSGLFYHFEGLSDNGRNYIVAMLPVNLPFLASDNNPNSAVPSGGIAFPAPSASPSDYNAYIEQLTGRIDSASTGQFNPSLDLLDRMMQSITVVP
jgi:hypothetical protein